MKGGLIRGHTNFKLINVNNYRIINLTSFLSVAIGEFVATGYDCTCKDGKHE